MNPQSNTTSPPPIDLADPKPVGTGEGRVTRLAADRLYQIAAVTAGLFLLATLL